MQNFNKNTFYTEQLWATASEVYLIMIWFCSRKTLQPKTLKHNKILTQLLKHCQIENFKETLKKKYFWGYFFSVFAIDSVTPTIKWLLGQLPTRKIASRPDNCLHWNLPLGPLPPMKIHACYLHETPRKHTYLPKKNGIFPVNIDTN